MNEGTIRVRKWVKSYLRKQGGWNPTNKRRSRVRGHYITAFVKDEKEVRK